MGTKLEGSVKLEKVFILFFFFKSSRLTLHICGERKTEDAEEKDTIPREKSLR